MSQQSPNLKRLAEARGDGMSKTKENKMQAFNNDPQLKQDLLDEIKWHQDQDRIAQGAYEDNGNFCAVGCAVESLNKRRGKHLSHNDHEELGKALDIPSVLFHLEDSIFEGLDTEKALTFPYRFIEAIPVGADLSLVTAKLVVWQFKDDEFGLKNTDEVKDNPELKAICEDLVTLYKRIIDGDTVTNKEWDAIYDRAKAEAEAEAWAWAWARAWAGGRARAWAWGRAYDALDAKIIELLKKSR